MLNSVSLEVYSNKKINNNSLILSESQEPLNLSVLQQGKFNYNTQGGYSLFSLNAPIIVGTSFLIAEQKYPYSITSETEGLVSVYGLNSEEAEATLSSKPSITITLLQTLLKEMIASYNKINQVNTFLKQMYLFHKKIVIFQAVLDPKIYENKTQHDFLIKGKELYDTFISRGGAVPKSINKDSLNTPEPLLEHLTLIPDYHFDVEDFNFLKYFITLPNNILAAIISKSPKLIISLVNKVNYQLNNMLDTLKKQINHTNTITDFYLKGDNHFLSQCLILQQSITLDKKAEAIEYSKIILQYTSFLITHYKKMWNHFPYNENHSDIDKIKHYIKEDSEQEVGTNTSNIKVNPKVIDMFSNQLSIICNISKLEPKIINEFTTNLNKLKATNNPLDASDNIHRLRRGVNNLYWEIYKAVSINYFSNQVPLDKNIELFLNYGIIDSELITQEQICYIYDDSQHNPTHIPYQIHTPIEWMQKIYNKEISTSINELGLTFFEILCQENKDKGWRKEVDLPDNINSSKARLTYEIKSLMEPNTRLTSGSVLNHFAIQSKYQITSAIDKSMLTKNKLVETINNILDKDFGAFHRELLYENKELGIQREFIQKRVVPNFILIPSAGNIFQFWQEREGNNKTSRGRINCPSIVTGDLEDLFTQVVAVYRWELLKTILGPDWNNISRSSLTSAYMDYIQFYKKNRILSIEMKEKITQEFKRFRDDRSKFVNDYLIWLKYESEGIQRLNKVARKLMAKHVPFTKKYREKLLKLPSYVEDITKSINLKVRKARELEPRYRKYKHNNNNELPQELQDTYKFFTLNY